MGCNCGKRRKLTAGSAQPITVLTMPNGETSSHATRLEAEAENIRKGGGGKFATAQP